jgi:hypothetical protein
MDPFFDRALCCASEGFEHPDKQPGTGFQAVVQNPGNEQGAAMAAAGGPTQMT